MVLARLSVTPDVKIGMLAKFLATTTALEVMLIVLVEILLMFLLTLDLFVLMFNLFDSI